jgi:outer membrane protein OmpA-like peptidoglycan-associated protein
MHVEKRKCKRSDIFLIIHFRLLHNSHECTRGIFRNYSDDGFSLESHNFDYKPGQILECTIKHPGSSASVSIIGKIVWKKDGWYDSAMGIKFLDMEGENVSSLRELADAGEIETSPIDSEDGPLSTPPVKCIQNIILDKGSPEEAESLRLTSERKIETPSWVKPSLKPRSAYFRFFLFVVLIAVIIFAVAARDGKDLFPGITLYEQKTESSEQGQNSMAVAVASNSMPVITGNDPELIYAEEMQANALTNEEEMQKNIIRDEITFAVNSTDISSKFYSVIDKVSDILIANPGLIVTLEGHTDSAGSEIYNLDLSMRRAASVRGALINKGISSSRIKIMCFGNSSPAAPNDIESGRMKNRRVEISIPLSHS